MNRAFTKFLFAVLLLTVAAAVYFYVARPIMKRGGTGGNVDGGLRANPPSVTNKAVAAVADNSAGVIRSAASNSVAVVRPAVGTNRVLMAEKPLSATEKSLERIDGLLADENLNDACALAKTLMNNKDPEVRQEVADIFGWIGLKALTELSQMLKDKDEDVASTALQHWESTVDDISDDTLKAQILVAGVNVLQNQDDIESVIMMFDSMDDQIGVRAIVKIIETGAPVASEPAREHYEFMTDEPYTNPQAAEAYLKKLAAEEGVDGVPPK